MENGHRIRNNNRKMEIEQGGCDVKWNGMGFGVWGSETGIGDRGRRT